MELIDAFDTAFAEFDGLVHEIGDSQWEGQTPCEEWSVRDLLNHLTSEHFWAPHLLRGETLEQVGDRYDGDVLGEDPVDAWARASAGSWRAFHTDGALDGRVHVTGGTTPAEEYGWQMTTDLAVHGWDLARGIGAGPGQQVIDEELARTLYERVAPQAESWASLGIFAPPVTPPEGASPQDRLVALLGRRPA
ncbi:TIGR03086 family metal-binding protein [Streptomyces sp. ODS28]|uniref:TIGR03086 family metal-binding protein n=1 Tax=Streptomyces sp. ODS28 TaxID=3136688 RepID=UPI0031EFD38E